jgi:hypothetical protein
LSRFARSVVLFAVVITGGLGAASSASAVTRYAEVGGDGPPSGAEPCPLSNPCDLQASVEDASVADGDEVIVLPGTYDLGTSTLTINDRILVRGPAPGQRPLITGVGDNTVSADNWLVRVQSGMGPQVAQLRDISIASNGTNSLWVGPGEVNRVSVDHNGSFLSGACQLVTEATINDSVCLARNNGGVGLVFSLFGGSTTNSIRNVTAASVQSHGIQVFSGAGTQTLNIKNTIAVGAPTDIHTGASGGGAAVVNATNSNYSTVVEGDGGSVTPIDTAGNQSADPIFANFALGDLHQAQASPTIDAGADGVSALDLDGQGRVQGPLPDIGASEYDQFAPDTSIGQRPKKRTRSARAKLTFSSTEPGSAFRCKVDRKPYRTCASPLMLKRLKPGTHKVLVKAVDAVGNQDPTASVARWRVLES